MRAVLCALPLLLGSSGWAGVATAEGVPAWLAGELRVAAGVDFSRGDYGEPDDTDVVYVPFTLAYLLDDFAPTPTRGDQLELRVTIPWLRVDGVLESGEDETRSESGIGDVLVRTAWLYYPEVDWPAVRWLPASEWGVQVKIPTASDGRSLGTGETDVSLDLGLFQRLGDFVPFATGGYRFIGDDTDDYDLRDGAFASVGVSWVLPASASIGVAYDWRESISRRSRANGTVSTADGHELSLFGSIPLPGGLRIAPYAVKGLSSGSPDFAVGGQIELRVPVR